VALLSQAGILQVSSAERDLMEKLRKLSSDSGSHSPSLATMQQELPELSVEIDACFLSNPLATELFWSYFNSDVLDDRQFITQMLEAYPSQNRVVAEQIAPTIGVDPGRLFLTNGATEAIQAIIHNYSSHIHVNLPTFSPYYEFAKPGQQVTTFQLEPGEDFALDPARYVQSVLQSRADTAVLISPNNPDGYLIPDEDLRWILSRLSGLKTMIVDESFLHFADRPYKGELPSMVDLTDQFDNVTVVKSMSKDFGIAGIRAGYAVMSPARVKTELQSTSSRYLPVHCSFPVTRMC
jgi:histidinol-phosphate/aromatic aminotransferase/cobyric acid decarboxylase-like protein